VLETERATPVALQPPGAHKRLSLHARDITRFGRDGRSFAGALASSSAASWWVVASSAVRNHMTVYQRTPRRPRALEHRRLGKDAAQKLRSQSVSVVETSCL
jgi:hypothetical protein